MAISSWSTPKSSTPSSAKTSTGNISTWSGSNEPNNPSQDKLKAQRQKQAQQDKQAQQQKQQQAQQAKDNSLRGKVKKLGVGVINSVKDTAEKTLNTAGAATAGIVGSGIEAAQLATGHKEASKNTSTATKEEINQFRTKGIGNKGGYYNPDAIKAGGGNPNSFKEKYLKPSAQAATDIVPYALPIGSVAKGASIAQKIASGAVQNAAVSGATTVANEALQGRLTKDHGGELAKSVALGGVLGAAIPAFHGALHGEFKQGAAAALEKAKTPEVPTEGMHDVMTPNQADKAAAAAHTKIRVNQTPSNTQEIGVKTPIHAGIKQVSETHQIGVRAPVKMTDAQYTSKFNKLSNSYEKAYKELDGKSDIQQKVLGDRIDSEHQSALDQLNEDYKNGVTPQKTTIKRIAQSTSPAEKTRGGLPKLGQKPKSEVQLAKQEAVVNKAEASKKTIQDTQSALDSMNAEKAKLVQLKAQYPGQPAVDSSIKAVDQKITELQKTTDSAQKDVDAATKVTQTNVPLHDLISYEGAPDTARVAQYKSDIEAGKPIEPIIVKRDSSGNLGIEDGKHRYEAAKQAGLTKIPVANPEELNTPTPKAPEVVTPKPKEGEAKTSGVAKSIEAKAIEKKLTTGFGDLAEFKGRHVEDQAVKVGKLITEKPDDMLSIVNGQKPLPEGMSGSMFIKGVEEHALQTGDTELLRKLAQSPLASETSIHASELRLLGEREPDSALAKIKEITAARRKASESRMKGSVDKVITQTAKEIKDAVKKPTKMDWNVFAESLKC